MMVGLLSPFKLTRIFSESDTSCYSSCTLYMINEGTSPTERGHVMLLVERLNAVKLEQHL